MQIARILQSQGFGSRRECRGLIRAGRVTVNGAAVDDPFAEFPPEGLSFTVDGEAWDYRQNAYLLLHKPVACECTHKPQCYPSIYSLLPPELSARGVQSVGRLDQDTTGLLLLSDDGQFIHTWSSGKKRIPKCYRVTLKHPHDAGFIAQLLDGVLLHDEADPVVAAACEPIDAHTLWLTITEGKYHQVKRMVAAAGNRVEALHRQRVGGLQLPEVLEPGDWCWLSDAHLIALSDFPSL